MATTDVLGPQPTGDVTATDPGHRARWSAVARWLRRLGPPLVFLIAALVMFWPVLVDPDNRIFSGGPGSDQVSAQWFLAHSAYAVAHLDDPFVTHRLNAPVGVNLAAQASLIGIGLPLAPLTLLAGVQVSYLVALIASVAGTATAWYWLLFAKLRRHWLAAALAALYCGFNPHLIAESTGRQHVALQVLIPIIIWQVIRLAEPDHPVRRGIILGALIAWQALIGEEALLFTAIGMTIFTIGYAVQRPGLFRLAGRYARGLGIAAGTALVLLAYPLWRQFFGPHHAPELDVQGFATRPPMWLGLPREWALLLPGTLRGSAWWSVAVLPVTGLPLLALLVGIVVALRRRPVVPACAAVVVVCLAASLGHWIDLGPLGVVRGPGQLIGRVPVLKLAMPERFAHVAVVAAAVILAYGLDALLREVLPTAWRSRRLLPGTAVLATLALVAMSTVVLWPQRPPASQLHPVPAFVSTGAWRPYVAGGRTLVSVPLASQFWIDGQRWAASTNDGFAIPRGYFLGASPDGGLAIAGAPPRWASTYLERTAATGEPPAPQPGDAERFLADLRYWRAGVLVLSPDQVYSEALRSAVTRFLGPPRWLLGAWIWDVRPLT